MPGNDGKGSFSGGMGRMGGNGAGTGGYCVCPACGHKQPHEQGRPCTSMQCPNCGANMVRE